MKIKRYDRTGCDDLSGIFVKHSDYASLEAKCAALAAELKQSQIDAGCYKHGMEASNARLVQVAAEGAALKEYLAPVGLSVEGTPSTDAFLAEVRAQGVERMIEVKQQQLDGMHPDTFAIGAVRDSIRRDIYELKVFAEILRQEAAQ